MAITEKLIVQEEAAAGGDANPNIMLDLNAGDVDSYDGDGDVWYDIHDFEFKPTTNVSEHFNTVIYTGTGTTNAITGVGFQPDLIWVKNRDTTDSHAIVDSVRGITSPAPYIASDRTDAQLTSPNMPTSVQSDGFTITGGGGRTNTNGEDYVAWCFKAGGVEETNTEGTVDSTVRANNDLGFSVVKTTGTSGEITFGHGLDSAPEMIINKGYNASGWSWLVYHKDVGTGKYLKLNSRDATTTNSGSFSSITSTTITNNSSNSTQDYINYCFTSKRGVSKVDSYIGNGTTDNKIYIGFEPAFFMIKNTSRGNTGWLIKDNVRGENSKTILANSNAVEYNTTAYWTCDFERDGIRLTYGLDNEFNRNGDTYIYYAIAKDTNETELADTVGFKPSIDPEDHFNTVIYTGTGVQSHPITGVGFQPDLVWFKSRNDTYNHVLYDSLRGTDDILNSNNSIDSESNYNRFTSFDTDGFTLYGNNAGDLDKINRSSVDFVSWCFKAGGAPSGSDKVSIDGTSYSTMTIAGLTDGTEAIDKLSVNTNLGFSIVKWTSPALIGDTVAHGLGQSPEMIILKSTSVSRNWNVFHKDVGTSKNLHLNTTDAANTSEYWTANTNTFSIQDYSATADWIAYCFASKRGVSKVGSYTGTGAAGNKIFTEFEPAFLMIKRSSTSGDNWNIFDNKRDTDTNKNAYLRANGSNAETNSSTSITFNRDGFTLNGGSANTSNQTHIYLAFAKNTNNEQPHLELNLEADSYSGSGDWLDSSGNGNNGTITGATHNDELGDFFEFNGSSDKVTLQSSFTTAFDQSDKTLEMWVNSDDLSSGFGMPFSMNQSSLNYGRIIIQLNHSNKSLSFLVGSAGSSTTISSNTWYHLAVSVSGSSYECFVNGDSIGTGTNDNYSDSSGDTTIGVYNSSNIYHWNGKIGQVRAYTSTLTQEQVRQNFNFTKPKYPNEFHGDIVGTPSWNSEGSFNISGGNYINLGSDAALNFSKDSSISVWVNPSNSTGNKGIITRVVNTSPFGYVLTQTSGNTSFTFYDSSGNSSSSSSASLPNNTWTHLAVTYDGSNLIFYKNGSVVSTTASTLTPYTAPANTLIGRYYSNINVTTYDFAGKISKVRAYNTALTQAEITALYNEGE